VEAVASNRHLSFVTDCWYETYYEISKTIKPIMPNVIGLPAMDAIAILENMGLNVKIEGAGEVKSQSIKKGNKVEKNQTVVIKTS